MQRTITRGVLLENGTVGVFTIHTEARTLHETKMQADDVQLALRNELSPHSSDAQPSNMSVHQASHILTSLIQAEKRAAQEAINARK